MFETAELGRTISKTEYNEKFPVLRLELLQIQQRLRAANIPVILVFAGVDGAGKGETVNLLNEWMDPRWIVTRVFGQPSDEERERPESWRYWRDLPAHGQIGAFLRSWYSQPVLDRVNVRIDDGDLDRRLDRISAFENMLVDDGALILKFWMHLGKEAQAVRFKELEADPLTSWRVTNRDWEHWEMYDNFVAAAEHTIMRTDTGRAPWTIVEGVCKRYRALTVGRIVAEEITKRLDQLDLARQIAAERKTVETEAAKPKEKKKKKEPSAKEIKVLGDVLTPTVTVLSAMDMTKKYDGGDYLKDLEARQGKANRLAREAADRGMSSILVFEGCDAAGKGGAIRRLTGALDARLYHVQPVAAPTDEENVHHYLWRFWRHLQRAGRILVFDRSWYGRVLVERIEGFASEEEWRRAYAEINDFEQQLVEHGIVLFKFWMNITKDEQLARFTSREKIAYKRWKLTDEDWRNRERWDLYEHAVDDMVAKTSTLISPWTLVEGNDKKYARFKVLDTFCDKMEKAIAAFDAAQSKPTSRPRPTTPSKARPTRKA